MGESNPIKITLCFVLLMATTVSGWSGSEEDELQEKKREGARLEEKNLEDARLQQQLLNRQLEERRLEQKRIEDAIQQRKQDNERWERSHGRL